MKKICLSVLLLISSLCGFAQVDLASKELALQLIQKNASTIGLTKTDIENSVVTSSYIIPGSTVRLVHLQQTLQGIPIYNSMKVLAFKEGLVASNTGKLYATEKLRATIASAKISAADAVAASAVALGVKDFSRNKVSNVLAFNGKADFGALDFSYEKVSAELLWYPIETTGELKLVWQVFMAPKSQEDYWLARIDAATGVFVDKQSLTIKCNFDGHDHNAKDHQRHAKQETKKVTAGALASPSVVDNASYRVIAHPAESPIHPGGAPALVSNPWTKSPGNATTLGWHYDGTTYYSTTRGNNVHAYEDRASTNAPGITEASTTAQPNLTFDFSPNFTLEPSVRTTAPNQQFNTTNLFYWSNLMHDLSYLYGFTESARNFQANNQGRGGAGNDFVKAEAQDGSGTNNANFSTPADGGSGRMQMFLWTAPTPDRDGDVDNGIIAHEYGHGISNRFTGNGSSCLTNAEQMGEGWSDYYGLMITTDWSTATLTDGATKPRGIGTYALNQPVTGLGIRQYRYSTDMTVNPLTYSNINTVAVPHGVGTIWCTALWDMTWEIIQQAGINPDIFNPSAGGGNAIALRLVNEGMRLQPCSPGFIDGRDAILRADSIFYNKAYRCAILKAFAKRGMGIGALQGSSNSRTDQTVSFVDCGTVATCNAPTGLASSSITTSSATVSWGAVTGATNYTVEYKLSTATSYTVAAAAATTTSVSITGLAAGSLYDWRVRTNCSASSSAFAAAQFTTSSATPCDAPTALTSSSITTSGATVSWTAASGASSYAVDYKTTSATTWTSAATGTTSTSVAITGLSAGTTYDWRVRTNCAASSSAFVQAQFTTSAPPVCNAPTALTTSAITTSGVTASWTAASGATSYAVDYKTAAATTWISAATATTATSVNLSGLTAGTAYNWRVRSNCAASNSAFVQANFTTTAAPTTCPGTFDVSTNGTASGAATIPFNTDIKGLINPAGDNDYYRFVITTGGTATITLGTLPADYDVRLYSSNGTTQLAIAQLGGTSSETLTRTYTPGTYFVRVYGYQNANNANVCYTLKVQTGTASLVDDGNELNITKADGVSVYPNPVADVLNVSIQGLVEKNAALRIFDSKGILVKSVRVNGTVQQVDVADLPKGVYFISSGNIKSKFIKQ